MKRYEKFVKILFCFLIILNVLDYYLTGYIINNGGFESNPILNSIINEYGMSGMAIFKSVTLILLGFTIKLTYSVNWLPITKKILPATMVFLISITTIIVILSFAAIIA